MANESNVQSGTLPWSVNQAVVGHLSLGLYRNFARAIKELVSNSYDAGATEVKVGLDLENARIVVRDNGRGMDLKEVEERFLTIGNRTPFTDATDKLGRRRIGTFGIGNLSVLPYCETFQLVAKKRGADSIIELTIDTRPFFEGGKLRLMQDARIPYKLYPSDLPKDVGETIIVMEGIQKHIAQELQDERLRGKSSIDKFSGFEKFRWTLCQYAPIQFPPSRSDLRQLFESEETVPMRLWLDGEELFRNIPEDARILDSGERRFGDVFLRYAIMTTMRPIEPEEARGIQIRIRNVAVGLPRDFDVTKFTGKVLGKLNYLCGEAHILGGLDSALMIDRDNLSYTTDVSDTSDFFRKQLTKWNDELEKWAQEDKQIYESLDGIEASDEITGQLMNANLIRFAKERLRLPKQPRIEKKTRELLNKSDRVYQALSRIRQYRILRNEEDVSATHSPIKVVPEQRTIVLYSQHPDFVETLETSGGKFRVNYDQWDIGQTPYAICRLSADQKSVTFNTAHPVFRSKLSDEIVKRLSLGIVLAVQGRKDSEELLLRLNEVLKEVLLG